MRQDRLLDFLLAEYARVGEEVRDEANRIVQLWFGLGVLVTSSIILEQQTWFTWVALAAVHIWFLLLLLFVYQFGRRIRYAIFLEKRINKEIGSQVLNFQQFLHNGEWTRHIRDKKYLYTRYIINGMWSIFVIIPFLIFYEWLLMRALYQFLGIDIIWSILISAIFVLLIIIAFLVVYIVFPSQEMKVLNEFLRSFHNKDTLNGPSL